MAINEQVGREELEAVGGIFKSLIDLLIDLEKEKNKKTKYKEKSGVSALIKHIKNGGDIKAHMVDNKDAKIMEACMKSNHIPYVATKTTNESGKTTVVFWYRSSDEVLMNTVKNKFIYEMGIGNGYIAPREFVNSNLNQNILVKKGFDDVELEVLLENAKKEGFMISFVENESAPGKYDVIYMPKNEEQLNRALYSMAYDLSGEKGKDYRSKIKAALENRDKFDKQIRAVGDEVRVIVDTENPHNFITVTADNFTTHCIDVKKERGLRGITTNVLADKNMISISSYNREELMSYVETLESPVIMELSEFSLIKGLTKTNEAIVIPEEEFREKYINLRESLKGRIDKYQRKAVDNKDKISDKIYTYENIPQAAQIFIYEEIENNGLDQTVMVSGNLACSEKDYPAVRNIVERILYKDMNSIEKIEAKMLYEHNEIINLTHEPIDVQYVIDLGEPDYVVKLTSNSITIFKNGNEQAKIESSDACYEDVVLKVLSSVKNPVVLNEKEWQSKERINIIETRANNKHENKAVDYLRNYEKSEKEILYNLKRHSDLNKLNNRQSEAYEKVKTYETEEIYVDRTLREKIQDLTTDKKLQIEIREKQEEISMC